MDHLDKAEHFLLSCIRDGLAHSLDTVTNSWVKPYPEVTGYLLSYFSLKTRLPTQILEAGEKMITIQHPTGGFSSFFNKEVLYTFDTSQITHGLTSLYIKTRQKRYLVAAQRAGNFLLSMQNADGSFFPYYNWKYRYRHVERPLKDGANWGSYFSHIQVKNAEALLLLSKVTKNPSYAQAALLMIQWGKRHCDSRFTHPFGYFLEGMSALDQQKYVRNSLQTFVKPKERNGFIAYQAGLNYAYVSGSVQLGILFKNSGMNSEAKRIYQWATKVQEQHISGGLFQYANRNGTPYTKIHAELPSWGTKYYLELANMFVG